jgi:glycosyltransferase involved in cell wall biosynthesis
MNHWAEAPQESALISWCERYACRHADLLISPNRHMFEWAEANCWELNPNRRIMPFCYKPERKPAADAAQEIDTGHAIFFGRLETRKGVDLFCRAVDALLTEEPGALHTVSLLGKAEMVYGVPAEEFVQQTLGRHPNLTVRRHSDFDSFQALSYIKENGGFVVMPSLLENSPFTVIESIENNIPFLASRVGGIPELAHPAALFDPTADSLLAALRDRKRLLHASREHPYSNQRAEQEWRELQFTPREAYAKDFTLAEPPSVSVCLAHYNHGEFLPDALASLAGMDYPGFEVIAVDDGSTDPESRAVFDRMAEQYPHWQFHRTENQGCGPARNHAAGLSRADCVTFFDADNLARPTMLSDLVRGMQTSGAHCLACHNCAFRDDDPPTGQAGPAEPVFIYNPVGACPEFVLHNVMGDTNFLVRREVFNELGGFSSSRENSAYADWHFLARLNLRGFEHDVVPAELYWYRVSPDSMLQQCNVYQNTLHALSAYYEYDPFVGRLISELAIPAIDRFEQVNNRVHHLEWWSRDKDHQIQGQAAYIEELHNRLHFFHNSPAFKLFDRLTRLHMLAPLRRLAKKIAAARRARLEQHKD